jgi:outer membrane protein OmpA-like peptidoglycan-associated protein/uncharacterized protein YidB (DUF937 family)
MATFDKLIQEIGSRYRLGPEAGLLVQETLGLITGRPGGIGAFLKRFKAAGFAVEVASWLGGPDPVSLTGQEVEQTLGCDVISEIANKVGVSQIFARTILGYAIPEIIVLLARGGAVPPSITAWASSFRHSAIRLSCSPVEEEQIRPTRTEHGRAAPVLGGLIIPGTTLLIMLGLLLGYFIGAGDRGTIQFAPIEAQNAPVVYAPSIPARLPLSNENYAFATIAGRGATETATASSALSGLSYKNQVGAPNQLALKFPTIYFTANSAEVLSSSNPLLLQAARLIKQLPAGTLVEITGYTHNIGSPITNMQLSQRRANAVRRALVHAGVDPAMLTAKGFGGSHSLASKNGTVEGRSNAMMEDRRRNDRRVEFRVATQ